MKHPLRFFAACALALSGLLAARADSAPAVAVFAEGGHSNASSPADLPEAFHLGTAAGPFGWSSAVADFDRDGSPDFAIADRSRVSGDSGYGYRILFAVSGQPPQVISFHSEASALTLTVEDVDDDHDLDVLVSEPASRNVAAVWVNDGHGAFAAASVPRSNAATIEPTALAQPFAERPTADLVLPRHAGEEPDQQPRIHLTGGLAIATSSDCIDNPSLAAAAPCRAPPPARAIA
ncbi:MAG TPA: FG-GAP repeat protein [Vicinamibacterales bacterium]